LQFRDRDLSPDIVGWKVDSSFRSTNRYDITSLDDMQFALHLFPPENLTACSYVHFFFLS